VPADPVTPAILRGPGIVLRAHTPADVVPLWEAVRESEAELSPWMPWCHESYEQEEMARWVGLCAESRSSREMFEFVIAEVADGRVVGACGLNQVDWQNRRANLGYWVRTTATGRGVATAAAGILARYGFAELGLMRAEVLVATGNAASQRVAVKLGATREGVLRNRLWLDGRPHDAVAYSLIPDG